MPYFCHMAKYEHDTIVPFDDSELSKKQQVASMFDDIAPRYDFINRFLSAGIDIQWRRKAIRQLKEINPQQILDVATGTGDMAIMTHRMLAPQKVTGIDISTGMLALGRKKIEKAGLQNVIDLVSGDSETIKFPDNSFDAVTVAFGVRNFENLEKGLQEIFRVLRPGGKLVVLEFSKPSKGFRGLYNLYLKKIAPQFGKLFSKNKAAYDYLNESIQAFPEGEAFVAIMNKIGYQLTTFKKLTLGICSIYCGKK